MLNENRQTLFHGTNAKSAYNILSSGKIEPRTEQVLDGRKIKGVSTSRSKKFSSDWGEVIFEFDADRLKHHNKVVPVDFLHNSPQYDVEKRHCSEEFVIGELNDVKRCLKAIYLKSTVRQSPYYDDLLDLLYSEYRDAEMVEMY